MRFFVVLLLVAVAASHVIYPMHQRTLDNMMRDDYADEVDRVLRGVRGDALYRFNETTDAFVERFVRLMHDDPFAIRSVAHLFLVGNGRCFGVVTNDASDYEMRWKLDEFDFFATRRTGDSGVYAYWRFGMDDKPHEWYVGLSARSTHEMSEYNCETSYIVAPFCFFRILFK